MTDNPEKVGFYSGLVVSHHILLTTKLILPGINLCICPILHCLSLGQIIRVSGLQYTMMLY